MFYFYIFIIILGLLSSFFNLSLLFFNEEFIIGFSIFLFLFIIFFIIRSPFIKFFFSYPNNIYKHFYYVLFFGYVLFLFFVIFFYYIKFVGRYIIFFCKYNIYYILRQLLRFCKPNFVSFLRLFYISLLCNIVSILHLFLHNEFSEFSYELLSLRDSIMDYKLSTYGYDPSEEEEDSINCHRSELVDLNISDDRYDDELLDSSYSSEEEEDLYEEEEEEIIYEDDEYIYEEEMYEDDFYVFPEEGYMYGFYEFEDIDDEISQAYCDNYFCIFFLSKNKFLYQDYFPGILSKDEKKDCFINYFYLEDEEIDFSNNKFIQWKEDLLLEDFGYYNNITPINDDVEQDEEEYNLSDYLEQDNEEYNSNKFCSVNPSIELQPSNYKEYFSLKEISLNEGCNSIDGRYYDALSDGILVPTIDDNIVNELDDDIDFIFEEYILCYFHEFRRFYNYRIPLCFYVYFLKCMDIQKINYEELFLQFMTWNADKLLKWHTDLYYLLFFNKNLIFFII